MQIHGQCLNLLFINRFQGGLGHNDSDKINIFVSLATRFLHLCANRNLVKAWLHIP